MSTRWLLLFLSTARCAFAFDIAVESVYPSQFSEYAHHVLSKKLTADTDRAALALLEQELHSWASNMGYVMKHVEYVKSSHTPTMQFYTIVITKYDSIPIIDFAWDFKDISPSLTDKMIPKPTQLSKKTYNPTDVDNALRTYVFELQKQGYVFAKAQWTRKDITRQGVHLAASIAVGKRYTFFFEGQTHLTDSRLIEILQAQSILSHATPQEMAEALKQWYHTQGFQNANVTVQKTYDVPETSTTVISFAIQEGAKYHIGSPHVEGLSGTIGISASEIFRKFVAQNHEHQYYSEANIQKLLAFFKEILKDLGFYQCHVALKDVTPYVDRYFVIPEIAIHLGPRSLLSQVVFENIPPGVTQTMLEEPLGPLLGRPLNKSAFTIATDRIVQILNNAGYSDAVCTLKSDIRNESLPVARQWVHLTITLIPGSRYWLKDVQFLNTCQTSPAYLERFVFLQRDHPVRSQDLEATIAALYATDIFRYVGVREIPVHTTPELSTRIIQFHFRCAERGSHEVGVGYYTDTGFKLFYELAYRNVLGSNEIFFLATDVNIMPTPFPRFTEGKIMSQLLWPYFLSTSFDSRMIIDALLKEARTTDKTTKETFRYDLMRLRLGWDLENVLAPWFKVTFHLYEIALDHVENFLHDPLKKETFMEGMTGWTWELDWRNEKPAATHGHYHMLTGIVSSEWLGGSHNINYIKFLSTHWWYISPFGTNRLVLAWEGKFGWISALGNEGFIPETQFFFLGGDNSIRGFAYRGIGPGSHINPKEVEDMMMLSSRSEIRLRAFGDLYVFAFWDTGYLTLNEETLEPFRHSMGGGLRLQTRLGAVTLAVAFPTDGLGIPSNQSHLDAFRIHLALSIF